jgi:hypothetical protein
MITRRTALALLVSAPLVPSAGLSHNNPSFEMTVVAEVPVEASPGPDGAFSAPFNLELPEKTIQLHYEVDSHERDAIRFALASGAEQVAGDLQHEGQSKPVKASPVSVVNVTGATKPFTIRIVAEHIVRKTA